MPHPDFPFQVAENAESLGVSLAKGFLVGGDSAGGHLAASVALLARDDPFFADRPITGQFLREPMLVHPLAWPEKYVSARTLISSPLTVVVATVPRVHIQANSPSTFMGAQQGYGPS